MSVTTGAFIVAAKHPTYTLVLEAMPDPAAKIDPQYDRDADYRLKLLLKHALRTWGFKCRTAADAKTAAVDPDSPRWDVMGESCGLNDIPAVTPEAAAEVFVRWLYGQDPGHFHRHPDERVTVRPHGQAGPVVTFDALLYFDISDVVLNPPAGVR